MSRLAILQLAPTTTTPELRAHFSTLDLPVTDAKVVTKKDGTSRGVGFVGFSSAEDANKAREYFDGTYLGGRRIKVDVATDAKSALQEPPRKKSKVAHVDEPAAPAQPVASTSAVAADAEELDDSAYLASRKKRKLGDERVEPTVEEVKGPAQQAPKEAIMRRLFVRNLPFTVTEDDLKPLFHPYGQCRSIRVVTDPSTGASKGLAYISYENPEDAAKALADADGTSFQGRLLHILPAVERVGISDTYATTAEGSLKKRKKQDKRKKADESSQWATLWLNADAVAQAAAVAARGTKADVLGREVRDPAVRLALAETALVAETKAFLAELGIDTDISNTRTTRSQTMILVKNLPYGTSVNTLRPIFAEHGTIENLWVSPSGVMGVVEFADRPGTVAALKNVSYRRIGKAPIYLEPATLGTPKPSNDDAKQRGAAMKAADLEVAKVENEAAEATLYIKNLAWATTDDSLAAALRHLPGFVFARIQKKAMPRNPDIKLSMGFGFVGFKTKEHAEVALPTVHGLSVDGHALQADFARRDTDAVREPKEEPTIVGRASKKVVVKNLAFEATKRDITELLKAHANVKSVRLPKKADQSSRGYAFIEFPSKADAELAINALSHTHLLGRHLVFEYTTDQMNIEKYQKAQHLIISREKQRKSQMQKSKSRGIEAQLAGKEDAGDADE